MNQINSNIPHLMKILNLSLGLGTLLGLGLILGLSSCAQSKTTEQASSPKLELTIGVMPSIDHLPLVIADKMGYLDSLGIDLELERFFSPMERDVALQTGAIGGAVSDYTSVEIQRHRGMALETFCALDGLFLLVVRPELEVSQIADLQGKRFALSSNTVIEYATDQVMGALPFEKVEVQKLPIRLEMLASGEIDAAVLPQPFAQIALMRGMKAVEGVLGASQPLALTGLVLDKGIIEQHPEAMKALEEAYNLGVSYLSSTPRAQWIGVAAQELGVEEEVVASMTLPTYHPMRKPSPGDMSAVHAWLKGKGLLEPAQ